MNPILTYTQKSKVVTGAMDLAAIVRMHYDACEQRVSVMIRGDTTGGFTLQGDDAKEVYDVIFKAWNDYRNQE